MPREWKLEKDNHRYGGPEYCVKHRGMTIEIERQADEYLQVTGPTSQGCRVTVCRPDELENAIQIMVVQIDAYQDRKETTDQVLLNLMELPE